jgi:hypothetical protein
MAINSTRGLLFLISLSMAIFSASASYLIVQGPVSGLLYEGGNITLGKIGPGESFYILASATTQNKSGAIINIGWDTLKAIELPQGWTAQPSPLYENPMKMKITAAQDTSIGTYKIVVRAINVGNYSKLGNLTFNAYINVSKDVFSAKVEPQSLVAGIAQPVNVKIMINNTGASDDPFMINAYGLPAWDVPTEVIASHTTISTYYYPIYVNEPGEYNFNLTVNSTTSPALRQTFQIKLVAHSSLLNDYSATGQGVVLSPIIYEPAYAFMLLLNNLYHLVFK